MENTDYPKNTVNFDLDFVQNVYKKVDFKRLKINSKVKVEGTKMFVPTLEATTYIENDQKIWINVTALFMTMARVQTTPAGVQGYIKANKTYVDENFDYINNLLGTNFIDYDSFQKILLGRTFIKINSTDFRLIKEDYGYELLSIEPQTFVNKGEEKSYAVKMVYNNQYDLTDVKLVDIATNNELIISYSNYTEFDDNRLPQNVKIVIKGNKPSQVLLENTKFDNSKMNTPFSIPEGYKKLEI